MKEFKKTEDGFFICEECEKICAGKIGLSMHINKYHKLQNYYDKWLKEENESVCKICGDKTEFIGLSRDNGYKTYCCKECVDKGRYIQTCLGNEKLYGVKNPYQRKDIKQKIKQTIKERYGDENYRNYNKIKETWLKKYGVEHNMYNKEIYEKQQQAGFNAKTYKYNNIFYRGTYEFDFLENFSSLFPDIINSISIKYNFEEKEHYYFPDFFIPSLNLIIEIKSSYFYNKFKDKCNVKKAAAISNGFNYIMIIDKDYSEINLFLKSS